MTEAAPDPGGASEAAAALRVPWHGRRYLCTFPFPHGQSLYFQCGSICVRRDVPIHFPAGSISVHGRFVGRGRRTPSELWPWNKF